MANRSVTSEELVRRSLQAIGASQSTLNAFRVVFNESALAAAADADRRRAAGDTAPLLGIPIAVKDDVDVAGYPTAFGTEGQVPAVSHDAEVGVKCRWNRGCRLSQAFTFGCLCVA